MLVAGRGSGCVGRDERAQSRAQFFDCGRFECEAAVERFASDLQRMRDIAQIKIGVALQERQQIRSVCAKPFRFARRQRHQAVHRRRHGTSIGAELPEAEFLEQGVRIRPADAERTHAGAVRNRTRRQRDAGIDHIERRIREVDRGIRPGIIQRRRNMAVPQAQRHLDAAGQTGHGIEVADIALDRADAAELPASRVASERLAQRRQLERIAQFCGGAVRLDVIDGLHIHAGATQYLVDDVRLPGRAGRVVTGLVGPVVVDGHAAQQGVDRIVVGDRLARALEQQHGDAFAAQHAVGAGIERPQMTIAGEVHAMLGDVAQGLARRQRSRTDERVLRIARHQTAIGRLQGHQRGRTIRVHEQAGATQAEPVGNQRRDRTALRPCRNDVLLRAFHQRPWGRRRIGVVAGVGSGHEHAGIGDRGRTITGVLDRFPRVLQKHAQLRIHRLRVLRGDVEELGVEAILVLNRRACADQSRLRQQVFRNAA